jgi:hypothetical protein
MLKGKSKVPPLERQLKSGKLYKRGQRRNHWKERTFILSKSLSKPHEATLRYFDNTGSVRGQVRMLRCMVLAQIYQYLSSQVDITRQNAASISVKEFINKSKDVQVGALPKC